MPPSQKHVPDLRTSNVPIEVQKLTNIQGLQEQAQTHWGLRRIQPFFPCIQKLFKMEAVRTPYTFGIKSRYGIQTISGPDKVFSGGVEQTVHLKKSMLFSSYNVMRGDYAGTGLPQSEDVKNGRIQSPHNSAYVGSLATILLSETGCQHFPKVYGVFSGVAEKHSVDISYDYEDLCDRSWFSQNIGHFFELKIKTPDKVSVELEDIKDGDVDLGIQHLTPLPPPDYNVSSASSESSSASDSDYDDGGGGDGDSGCSTDYCFEIRSCGASSSSSSSDDEGGEFDEPEDEEGFAHAVFKDAPIQVTVMEKCEGTMYKLFKENPSVEKRCAWMAQVIFALAFAQRTFGLVHNDLHVMNVMYIPTDKEFFYYNMGGKKVYRVPTYGKLMKIIDFDRATFSVKLPKLREAKFFMSDQFHIDEEAGGQYNVEPFYNPKYQEVKPNASFDLVRLATSLFWDCFPRGVSDEYNANPIYKMFMQWLTLPDGTSVLFRNAHDGDKHERYEGFQLYKAIARWSRDAVPKKQIEVFGGPYVFEGRIPSGENCLSIDP
jgi:hypothetical protein